MNKALKFTLITMSIAVPVYIGVRYITRKRDYEEATKRFKENDTEKKLIIMQILITKGENPTQSNIDSYMRYSLEELKGMLNKNVEPNFSPLTLTDTNYFGQGDMFIQNYSNYNYDYNY